MRKTFMFIGATLLILGTFSGLSRADRKFGPPFFNGKILPTPQRVEYLDEFVVIHEDGKEVSTCILVKDAGLRSSACIDALSSRIENLGGKVKIVTDEKTALSFKSVISIGANKLMKEKLGKYGLGIPQKEEGYILYPLKESGRDIILCAGRDERGTVWSVQSLIQLITRDKDRVMLLKARVFDYPYVRWRAAFRGSAAYKYNLSGWVMSSKWVKGENWREVWGGQEWIGEIIEKMKPLKRDKIVPLVPLSVVGYTNFKFYPTFSDPDDMKILKDISRKIAGAGGAVVLMLDDNGHKLTPRDKARFGTLGEAHRYAVNEIYGEMKKANPSTLLIFCPPLYFGAAMGCYAGIDGPAYVRSISRLPQDIRIHWTGADPIGRYVGKELIGEWQRYYGRKLFFFDNDWQWRKFGAKDFCSTHPDIYKYIEGYFMTGSGDIGMITLADYLWNPKAYNSDKSLKLAVEQLAGTEVYPVFKRWREVVARCEEAGRMPESSSVVKQYVAELTSLSAEIKLGCRNTDFATLVANETRKWEKTINMIEKRPHSVPPEMVTLENDLIKLSISPTEGGKIDEFIDKKRGRNLLFSYFPTEKGEHLRAGRAYTEFAVAYSPVKLVDHDKLPFEVALYEKKDTLRIRLTAAAHRTEGTDYSLSRTISLKGNTVEIATELKNIGSVRDSFRLRIHPEFALPVTGTLNRYYLYTLKENAELKKILIDPSRGGLSWVKNDLPRGMWGIGDVRENWGLFNYFDTNEITQCYYFADWVPELRTLELFSRLEELEPGESLKVAHKYTLVDKLDEFLKGYRSQ